MKKVLFLDLDDTIANSSASYEFGKKAAFKYLKTLVPDLTEKRFFTLYNQARKLTHQQLKHTAASHNRLLYFQKMNIYSLYEEKLQYLKCSLKYAARKNSYLSYFNFF